jgi:(E)-4-hydroxy-3-methyl-but-2-enyl pyrophosphate reductase
MSIIIAETAGFCVGVKRAVNLAIETPEKTTGSIFTYGPLIHNPQVLAKLEKQGISILETVPEQGDGTIIIRAHGVSPTVINNLHQAGFDIIDATCPKVCKVQAIIKKHTELGYMTIIIGDLDHPEVIGLTGCAAPSLCQIVDNFESLTQLPNYKKAIIVAQTTQDISLFAKIEKWAKETHPNYLIFNTICDSTENRQQEISLLSNEVDCIVVIGGYNSGNTRRLAEIAKKSGKPTFHIETSEELKNDSFSQGQIVGVTAGASTPSWIISDVCKKISDIIK